MRESVARLTITRGRRSWDVTFDPYKPLPFSTTVPTTDGPVEHRAKTFEELMALVIDQPHADVWAIGGLT